MEILVGLNDYKSSDYEHQQHWGLIKPSKPHMAFGILFLNKLLEEAFTLQMVTNHNQYQ
jgi:hypothetical protein